MILIYYFDSFFLYLYVFFFFFNDTATTEIYTLSLHDALPIYNLFNNLIQRNQSAAFSSGKVRPNHETNINIIKEIIDRKSGSAGMPRPISYAVFCLKKKKITNNKD